jgi:hypothetical protein
MSLKARIARLTAEATRANSLTEHWARRHRVRLAAFDRLADAVPDSHQARLTAALEPWAARVFDPQDHPGSMDGDRDPATGWYRVPAVVQWVVGVMDAVEEKAEVPEPVPAAVLDELLARPHWSGDLWRCEGCGLPLPGRPGRCLGPDPDAPSHNLYTYERFPFAACPCCGGAVPELRHPMKAGHYDDPADPDDPVEPKKLPPATAAG